jgi:hypothetical protein
MHIEDIQIKKLIFLEKNPRKITADQMLKLQESLQNDPNFLEARPILINKIGDKYNIYAGNQRVKAAIKLGWKSIKCHVEQDLSEDQMRQRIIKDNKSYGEWDYDILANEWNPADLIDYGFIPEELHLEDIKNINKEKEYDESIIDNLELIVNFKLSISNELCSSFENQLDELLKKFPSVKKEKRI